MITRTVIQAIPRHRKRAARKRVPGARRVIHNTRDRTTANITQIPISSNTPGAAGRYRNIDIHLTKARSIASDPAGTNVRSILQISASNLNSRTGNKIPFGIINHRDIIRITDSTGQLIISKITGSDNLLIGCIIRQLSSGGHRAERKKQENRQTKRGKESHG